jgi:hypothetical protein
MHAFYRVGIVDWERMSWDRERFIGGNQYLWGERANKARELKVQMMALYTACPVS